MLTQSGSGARFRSNVHEPAHLGDHEGPRLDHLPRSQLGHCEEGLAPPPLLPRQHALWPRQHQGALPPHAHRPQEALHPHDHGRRVHRVQQEAFHGRPDVRLPDDLWLLSGRHARPGVQRDRVHLRPHQRPLHSGQRGGDQAEAGGGGAGQVRDRLLQRPLHGGADQPALHPVGGVGHKLTVFGTD